MKIIVDLRSLGGNPWSGVPLYTRHIVAALTQHGPKDQWVGFVSGRSIHPPIIRGIPEVFTDRTSTTQRMIQWRLPGSRWPGVFPTAQALFMPNWNIIPAAMPMPVVIVVHDCWIWRLPWDGSRRERLWHRAIAIPRLLKSASRVICVSQSTQQELLFYCPWLRGKTHVVLSASGAAPAHTCTAACRQSPSPRILIVSDSHQRKNLGTVLRAIESLPQQWSVDIVGCIGVSKFRNARFHRNVGAAAYDALLAHAQVVIYDSLYEGFGFPAQEALERKAPVIISSSPALVETVGARAHAVVNPLDWRALAIAISACRDKSRQEAAPSPVRTWEDVASETWSVLQEAVDAARRRAS
ncbi:glycosyltransferase [Candidatus Uhrbacteria bacterium]|nr:glycosyltransferase [Candidatus Uhrbacteria bacterium]